MGKFVIWAAFFVVFIPNSTAFGQKKSVKIVERTNFYSISGKTASDFARSMSRNGPYSRQHRRRAWATASHNMTFQLIRSRNKTRCKVRDARIEMKITYEMPKLASASLVSKRQRAKWRKMYSLLNRHERVHGKYYRQLAYKARRELRKLKTTRNCSTLDKNAKKLVKQLNADDRAKNDAFDARDNRNYRRMERLFSDS